MLIVDSLGLHLVCLVGVGALDGWEPAVRGGLTVMRDSNPRGFRPEVSSRHLRGGQYRLVLLHSL
ncbi:MAG TPA: hypothetical protein VK975_03585 [Acidimicrobiales bacterium]|nr:hypothetical protein [Acidimicrobiales bacterium]